MTTNRRAAGPTDPPDSIHRRLPQAFDRAIDSAISTGSLKLDLALGGGGLPAGALVEVFGASSSGKTTLCQAIVSQAQQTGKPCAWIDADHSLDAAYAARCGVDLQRLYVCEPACEEQALEMAEALAASGEVAAIVLDPVTALVPQAELNAGLGGSFASLQEKLLDRSLHRLAQSARRTGVVMIFTSQLRRMPGILHDQPTSTACLALKLRASVRLEMKPMQPVLSCGEIRGNRVQVSVIKNRFGATCQPFGLDIMYNHGISRTGEILDLAIDLLILTRQDSVYAYRGLQLGTERENLLQFLRDRPDVSEEIEREIRRKYSPPEMVPVRR